MGLFKEPLIVTNLRHRGWPINRVRWDVGPSSDAQLGVDGLSVSRTGR